VAAAAAAAAALLDCNKDDEASCGSALTDLLFWKGDDAKFNECANGAKPNVVLPSYIRLLKYGPQLTTHDSLSPSYLVFAMSFPLVQHVGVVMVRMRRHLVLVLVLLLMMLIMMLRLQHRVRNVLISRFERGERVGGGRADGGRGRDGGAQRRERGRIGLDQFTIWSRKTHISLWIWARHDIAKWHLCFIKS
jgi:hypothetical protein